MENQDKDKMEKNDPIKELREKYAGYEKKFSLPSFGELNREFGIERAEKDSELFLREIIKVIMDKFQNYMRFIESLLNPSGSSLFAFSIVKLVDNGNRQKLSEVYKKISEVEIKIINLDLESNEEIESEFIKYSYKTWVDIKKDLISVMKFVEENYNTKREEDSKKNYFG